VVGHVEDVKYQSLPSQIKDSLVYAKSQNMTFNLHIRPNPGTRLSGPLLRLVYAGRINLVELP